MLGSDLAIIVWNKCIHYLAEHVLSVEKNNCE